MLVLLVNELHDVDFATKNWQELLKESASMSRMVKN